MTDKARGPALNRFGRDGWLVLAIVISLVALVLSLLGIGLAIRAIDDSRSTVDALGAAGTPVTAQLIGPGEGEELLARPGILPQTATQ